MAINSKKHQAMFKINIPKSLTPKHKKMILSFFSLVLITSTIVSFTVLSRRNSKITDSEQALAAQENLSPVEIEDSEVDLKDKKTLTVLLLGYGGSGHAGGFLADAIQLVHLNFEKNQLTMISIPRDLWVKLPNGSQAKINQSLSMGADRANLVASGGKVAKKMAEVITDLEVDYFVAVDFVGFKRMIGENLGSITVDVPETLEDKWYPIHGEEQNPCDKTPEEIAELSAQLTGFELEKQFECRYERIFFPKGENKMEGGDALAYVRSRHGSAGGDFSRSQRQHALIMGVRDKLFELEFWENSPALFDKLSKNITTDVDLEAIEYLLPLLKLVNEYHVKEVVISTENVLVSSKSSAGAFILIPKEGVDNWRGVKSLVRKTIEEQ